ncbi:MAG: hypothetical protein HY690_10300 [Chloroflexi bacterium]|nr:hypothetical protein [Chloroflexota bacterium]
MSSSSHSGLSTQHSALGAGDYTPFGYLRNPFAVARSWEEGEGGGLRATLERPGFGWVYPWPRQPSSGAGLELGCSLGAHTWHTRADFAQLGYRSAHHSCLVFSYDWRLAGLELHACFLLAERDVLLCVVDVQPRAAVDGSTPLLHLRLHGWRRAGAARARLVGQDGLVELGAEVPPHWLILGRDEPLVAATLEADAVIFTLPLEARSQRLVATLARGPRGQEAGRAALARADHLLAERLEEDRAFWAACPRLEGDWPAHWRNGWVYDLETTRMLIFPPGGIFTDVWPAWMVDWPRAVLAEGSLDTMRLSYAQPELAQRAALSLFRDTPGPNVPCVFQGGEPNMVAADGSVCGTSPAWCIPFYNLWLLYLRTLDRAWLAELLPHLEAYLRWWLAERTDEQGWVVYKCTWESGEDASPRLDPDREGDHVIAAFTRPVELQATLSHSATILACFARELGQETTATAWEGVAAEYRRRTRQLWDPRSGRFRDWDKRRNAFIAPSGASDYWGSDPTRFSPLSLAPLLFGVATPAQRARLRTEVEYYAAPPAIEWPSWSWVVLESAAWAGYHDFAARVAAEIVERVYRANDRRSLEPHARPMPGVAPEYWPLDLASFQGSDAYGWGANTAALLLRHVVGFLESPFTAGCRFRLVPAGGWGLADAGTRGRGDAETRGREDAGTRRYEEPLPASPRPRVPASAGGRYRVANLGYRGWRFDLTYESTADGIETTLELAEAAHCRIEGKATRYRSRAPARLHRFRLTPGQTANVDFRF